MIKEVYICDMCGVEIRPDRPLYIVTIYPLTKKEEVFHFCNQECRNTYKKRSNI